MTVSVREAKANLSRLLDDAAAGNDVIITCDGKPKARLVGLTTAQVPFLVNWNLLRVRRGAGRKTTPAENHVRADRDSRD